MTTLKLPSWPCFRPGLGGTALVLAGLKRFAIDGPPEFLGDDETIGCWIDLGGWFGGPGIGKYGFVYTYILVYRFCSICSALRFYYMFHCFIDLYWSFSDSEWRFIGVWGLQRPVVALGHLGFSAARWTNVRFDPKPNSMSGKTVLVTGGNTGSQGSQLRVAAGPSLKRMDWYRQRYPLVN